MTNGQLTEDDIRGRANGSCSAETASTITHSGKNELVIIVGAQNISVCYAARVI